jgi:hypothetical protein
MDSIMKTTGSVEVPEKLEAPYIVAGPKTARIAGLAVVSPKGSSATNLGAARFDVEECI